MDSESAPGLVSELAGGGALSLLGEPAAAAALAAALLQIMLKVTLWLMMNQPLLSYPGFFGCPQLNQQSREIILALLSSSQNAIEKSRLQTRLLTDAAQLSSLVSTICY